LSDEFLAFREFTIAEGPTLIHELISRNLTIELQPLYEEVQALIQNIFPEAVDRLLELSQGRNRSTTDQYSSPVTSLEPTTNEVTMHSDSGYATASVEGQNETSRSSPSQPLPVATDQDILSSWDLGDNASPEFHFETDLFDAIDFTADNYTSIPHDPLDGLPSDNSNLNPLMSFGGNGLERNNTGFEGQRTSFVGFDLQTQTYHNSSEILPKSSLARKKGYGDLSSMRKQDV